MNLVSTDQKHKILSMIRDAMRNYPPLKVEVIKILKTFEDVFPELQVTEGIVPDVRTIPVYWFEILDAVEIYSEAKNKIKKKQIGDAFAYLAYLSLRLHLHEDLINIVTPEEVFEIRKIINLASVLIDNPCYRR